MMTGSYGADVSQPVSVDQWRGLMGSNTPVSTAQVRCYQSSGRVDANAVQTIKNAKEAGIASRSAYHFPTTTVTPAEQAKQGIGSLAAGGITIDHYWLDVELNPAMNAAHWSHDTSQNATFIQALVQATSDELAAHPELECDTIGIYTRAGDWNSVTGGVSGFGHLALWWIYLFSTNRDGPRSFDRFEPFAGWSTPEIVQFDQDISFPGGSPGYDLSWGPASVGAPVAPTVPTARASAPAAPAAPASVPATPTPAQKRPFSYTVEAGDTFESLVAKFGVDRGALASANNIINPADVKPGRVLTIP